MITDDMIELAARAMKPVLFDYLAARSSPDAIAYRAVEQARQQAKLALEAVTSAGMLMAPGQNGASEEADGDEGG